MKAVIQRVKSASVKVDESVVGEIASGILVFIGIEKSDTDANASWLLDKIINLRIFNDIDGKMNLALRDVGGSLLVVSQFTIAGNCNKGKRPSFDTAAGVEEGKKLYDKFVFFAKNSGVHVETGIFQADMEVSLVNDGPVTFILEKGFYATKQRSNV